MAEATETHFLTVAEAEVQAEEMRVGLAGEIAPWPEPAAFFCVPAWPVLRRACGVSASSSSVRTMGPGLLPPT